MTSFYLGKMSSFVFWEKKRVAKLPPSGQKRTGFVVQRG